MATPYDLDTTSRAFQTSPLGSMSSLSTGPGTPQMRSITGDRRRMESAYRTAMRSLRREARREDNRGRFSSSDAAMGLVNLTRQAQADGVNLSGIQSSEDNRADDARTYQSMVDGIARGEAAIDRFRGRGSDRTPGVGPGTVASPGVVTATTGPNAPSINPSTQLGQFAQGALNRWAPAMREGETEWDRTNASIFFRRGLDRALGQATTQAEVEDLRNAGTAAGVTPEAFARRENWWRTRRRNS